MEEQEREQREFQQLKLETERKLKERKNELEALEEKQKRIPCNTEELSTLKKAIEELEIEQRKIKAKEEDLKKKEKLRPWNVDTIGHAGFTKTVINTKPARKEDESELPDEVREKRMKDFVKENEKKLKEFGMLRRYDDSKKFLQENQQLVCENTANYLVIWCINLEMEEKHVLMEHVAHQCMCMQYILELSKQLDVDPRACVGSFFSRIQIAEVEYKKSFEDELTAFKDRIRKRAAEKVAEALKEDEEEERLARLGPGGLDPVEVFESLPEALQKCFEVQDIPLLQKTIDEMPEEEAKYHMKRCVDSGLWVPDAKSKNKSTLLNEGDQEEENLLSEKKPVDHE
ncbi:hsp90 co-chaperone Cdc37 isoform X2 [Venturia canescens]|nr:hsp90 co-chaperone Cdc37 isoform X2 [Venturia canescens]XP_043280207.1 hsp90 co-chaperone Cdc37 isoform X2 [Venturia canescens]